MHRIILLGLLAFAPVAGCAGEIYVRDGVTDGDTFYLSQRALIDSDPVLQSWVSYSLARSTCQLEIGGPNPARASSFECERIGRRHLVETWSEKKAANPAAEDRYLDELVRVADAGFLDEYVAHYFRRDGWRMPDDIDRKAFGVWRRRHLGGHRPMTRLTGSWNFARNVNRSGFPD